MTEDRSPGSTRLTAIWRWLRLRRLVALGCVLWVAAATVLVVEAKSSLDRARLRIDRSVEAAQDGEILSVGDELRPAAADLRRAHRNLRSPILAPLRIVPILGRQLESARALSELGAEASTEAERLLELLEVAAGTSGDSAIRFESFDLEAVHHSIERLHLLVASADLGPTQGLVGPLADARTEVAEMIARHEPSLSTAVTVTAGLRSFQNDSRYLVLGANVAEMQVGGGMILSVAEVSLGDEGVEFTGLESTDELYPIPVSAIVDADVENRWGFVQPTDDFRKLGVTPRFDEFVAPQAMQMWEAKTGREVDGAILIDPRALSRLLGVVGPAEIDGVTYDEESLYDYLVQEQYSAYPSSDAGEALRRARLAEVTAGVLEAIVAGPHDLATLADVAMSLVRGRHLIVFGAKPVEQQAWAALGADGSVDGRQLGVFIANLGVSKLDPYLDVEVEVDEQRSADGATRVIDLDIAITNSVKRADRLPDYVVGPWERIGLDEAGSYVGRLVIALPASTSDARFLTPTPLEVFGPDGQGVLMGTRFRVNPGRTNTLRVRFEVPLELGFVSIIPSARPEPIWWQWAGHGFLDREGVQQSLDDN